ncbi:MAG: hypothetical protein RMI56_06715 [Sulfolobales archaeon]|nr:hypothetical protein [Sulfolobales archaeon]
MDSYNRDHIVRVCREKCLEIGFSGEAFRECVEFCVKSSKIPNAEVA